MLMSLIQIPGAKVDVQSGTDGIFFHEILHNRYQIFEILYLVNWQNFVYR